MKRYITRVVSIAMLLLSYAVNAGGSIRYGETEHHTICPGNTIQLTTRSVVVTSDTILNDTLITAIGEERDSLIVVYDVNVYPHFEKDEYKRLRKGSSYTWQDTTITDPGVYWRIYHTVQGCDSIYRLHVSQPYDSAVTFTLCEGEHVTFNGKTYNNAGVYEDISSGDTAYTITIIKHPSHEYVQYGVLDRTHPYYWQYMIDGESKTDTLDSPGVYVYTTHDPETGCNDIWKLVLTRDESSYHFLETVTICENEPFSWRGREGLNRTGIGQTTHYYDRYRTAGDQDSIYELVLTVQPVLRTSRTIPFCDYIVWNNKEYRESTVLLDTIPSVQYGCDSIITTILAKGIPFHYHDTATIVPGEVLVWRGRTISNDGYYEDKYRSASGCDSIYSLGVGLKEAAPVTNTRTYRETICEGDGFEWRNKTYYNSGTYVDTIYKAGTQEIDSLMVLILTVGETYEQTERVTFLTFPQTYREQVIPIPGRYEFHYQSSKGCDSTIIAFIDREVYRDEQTVVICPNDPPYIWSYDGEAYSVSGKYTKVEQDKNGNDSVIHVLNLKVNYIPDTQIEATICKGGKYAFGDQILTQSGVYRHVFHTIGGCDSTVVLSLNVLTPDTTYLAIQREQGTPYTWNGKIYREAGTYFYYGTNRFGCDSVAILEFTYNQVDTIEAQVTVCPNELPFRWNGIEGNQTQHYTKTVQQAGGNYIYYSLYLTVREVVQKDTTFTICADGSITFNGKTYTEGGYYRDTLGCDTMLTIHVIEYAQQVYETRASLGSGHGYTWTYWEDGTEKTKEFTAAGTYEYESPNETTGCSELWRLILTKDETVYHFVETLTQCEGDAFEWHGLKGLTNQGIGETRHYFDEYKTRTGKDSIYELVLTVTPIERTVRTITFCGETTWKGVTYTQSAVVYDTIATENGCYRIERINLDKAMPFYYSESKELPQGTVLHWHGQTITTDGTYHDYNTTIHGCDSIYEIHVTIIPAAPETNQYAEELSTCEGDTILWRGKNIWRSGTYVDTVYKAGINGLTIDSIFSLKFTVWPAPKDTTYQHLYTCSDGSSIRYNGKDYYQDETIITTFHTIHGCDSVVKAYLHFNTALYFEESDTIADTELPYRWTYKLADDLRQDTILTHAGTYTHIVSAEGGCVNQEQLLLIVYPTYLYEQDTTICETALPFHWLNGPDDHLNDDLQHAIGETKQYEYRYKTVNNTDSIYRLHLTIDPAPKRTERISICENKDTIINGKSYFDPVLYPVGSVFRDTAYKHNDGNVCDSIIYYEITKIPQRHIIETRIMHVGDTIQWQGDTITEHLTKTYTHETEIDPSTGCEMIYQLRVIAEHRTTESICILDTPYTWTQNGVGYYTTGMYTDTVFDTDGKITEFHRLDLRVDEVPHATEQYYVCAGYPEMINGKWYGKPEMTSDTMYRDTILNRQSPISCDSVIYLEIYVSGSKRSMQTVVLPAGETMVWNKYTITQGGQYCDTTVIADGCDSISILQVVLEQRKEVIICTIDTAEGTHPDKKYPYEWVHPRGDIDTLYTSGIYTDTIYDEEGFMSEFYTLHLTITQPYDTTVYVHGCQGKGAFWRDEVYYRDTTFVDRIEVWPYTPERPCDSVYHVNIVIDTVYTFSFTDTICEEHLPYILGRLNPDTLWTEGTFFHPDRTLCGCDSSIYLTLRIIPKLTKNDSTFVCEDKIKEHPVILGDTVTPWFDARNGGLFHGTWEGKWHGVAYTSDTIVWNCDHSYFHHIIMRPRQDQAVKDTFYLCQGDSVQLFWPHSELWVDTPGVYYDTIPTNSPFYDNQHGYMHNDRDYLCDSIVQWTVLFADTLHKDTTVHIAMGDSLYWNNQYLYAAGTYDSIGYATDTNSLGQYCKFVMTMHLYVDSTYYYRDTLSICEFPGKEVLYQWADGFERTYTMPDKDSTFHVIHTLPTLLYRFDSIYDLYVDFHQKYFTQIKDTICEGNSKRFDWHHRDNTITQRFLTTDGIYYDTITALNGCDSIIELYLKTRDSIPSKHVSQMITDREIPYLWTHQWRENGADTTHTDTLRATGIYRFTMPSVHGCDSTVVMHFTVHQTHVFRDTIDVCAEGKTTLTHFWSTGLEQRYTVPESDDTIHYYDTLPTRILLDSIYDLYVNYHQVTKTYLDAHVCYGDSMPFGLTKSHTPRFISKTGVYEDTLTRVANGCDSIIIMRLNVFPRYLKTYVENIADSEAPYIWHHQDAAGTTYKNDTLYAAGEYTFHFTNSYGCDSIDSLSLRVHATYLYRDSIQICQSETPYTWEGITDIYETGEYTKRLQTHDGYDSTRVLFVKVLPIRYDTITAYICEGDSMRFGLSKTNQPRFIYNSGLYNDTLTTVHGCDSIITLSLNIYPRYFNDTTVHIADVDTPYVWRHSDARGNVFDSEQLYAAGRYGYLYKSVYGCDSIDSLTLVVHPTYLFRDTVTICRNETPYTWYDKQDIYESGEYTKRFLTHDGYDSTYVRYIHVLPVPHDTVRHAMCEGGDYFFNGVHYTEGGTYVDTLASYNGCDSIVTLLLTVNKPIYVRIPVDIYEGEGYEFYGERYTSSGTYRHYGQTPEGCDSIAELFLTVHPLIDTTVIVCSSELPYIWINKWSGEAKSLYQAGIYRNDTTYVNGQRTFYTLQLIVNEPIQDTIRTAICDGSSYQFDGKALTTSGIYRDTVKAVNGCDSVITLILTVNKPYYRYQVEHVIEGQSVEFYGETYNTTGTYTHYGRTPEGCDSTSVLQLIVHPLVDTIVTVCKSELPYQWVNKWNGSVTPLYTAGLYRNDTTYVNGEKMYYGLQLVVTEPAFDTIRTAICDGSSYQFDGKALTTSGIYRDTVKAVNGCDSVITLILTVNKPYYRYQVEHVIEGQSVEFYGETYNTTGTYTHYGRTPEGCDSTSVLQLIVHPLVDTIVTVCKSELPYQWVNKWNGSVTPLYTAGLYRNDTTYVNGEKMYYGLQLVVTEPNDSTIYREICEGDLYNFNNRFLSTAGEYRDTLKNTIGCDSIVILHLNVLKKYYNTINRTIYQGDTVIFHGDTISEAGVYPIRFTSSYGCDSIIELRLSVIRLFDDSVTVCANDLPYLWTLPSNPSQYMTIYESGIYRDTVLNSEGLQSVVGLKVNVLPIAHAPEPIIARICEGDVYKFGGNMLTEQGTYYDTLTAANGCDSVVMLSLQVQPLTHQVDNRTIFEGDTVIFYGDTCTTSGIYTHTVPNGKCTDTYQLILTVLKEFHVDTTAYVCENDLPFEWHGVQYNKAGDYSLPTTWNDSSRVVTTLHLHVHESFYTEKNIRLCEGNVFIFRRDTFRTSAIFYDTIPTLYGCDSIIKYSLQVHPKFERWDTAHISDKDYYDFNGRQLTIPGDYEYTGSTENGCDSSIFLHLEVHPSYLYTEYRNICAPDSVHWRGQVIQMDTAYQISKTTTRYGRDTTYTFRDPYLTRYGFDSIYELKLIVHPSFYIYEQHLIKEGEQTTIHGIKITKPDSIYSDTLRTFYGCDSIYQIAVNTKRMIEVERDVKICDGTYYDLYGEKLTKTGKYTKISPNGDTIAHINLTINPISAIKQRIVIMDEEVPYIYGGRLYTPEVPVWDAATQSWDKDVKTTIENSMYLNQYGCDSTVYLEFVVTTHYSDWNQIPLCSNETLIIDNDTITRAGYYTFVRRSDVTKRMDSLYRVEIYEAPKYEMPPIKRTICEGDTVHFFDRILDVEGDYSQKLKSVDGCDSIITLHLTVTPTTHKETSVRIYEQYLPYIWQEDNRECYKSGDYVKSWQTGECINSSTLHLTVVQALTEERIVCGDDSIKWRNDKWYSKEGYYYDTIYKPHTDTITDVFVLHLIKGLPTEVVNISVGEIAEEANEFDIAFTTNSGLYYTTKVNVLFKNGPSSAFSNIYNAPTTKQGDQYIVSVPVPQYSDTCYENHHKYIKPGYYSVQVQLDNGACGRSESKTEEFLVKYPSWIIQQNWQDVVAPLNAQCNCGYEFSKVEWKDAEGYPYTSKAADYLYNSNLKPGDQVVMWATRKGEKVAIPSHPLTIVSYTWNKYDDPILVYPTQAPRHMPAITIEAPMDGHYAIYSSTGSLISTGKMTEGTNQVTLPSVCGMYFIRTTRQGKDTETHKVLLY